MKLHQLFSFFNLSNHLINANPSSLDLLNTDIQGIYFDARQVKPNSVFVAIKGYQKDGHEFVSDAIKNGAIALVVENKSKVSEAIKDSTLYVFEVNDSRSFLDLLASRFYQNPSHELFCFGVTGTNGKTSVISILEHILNNNKKLTGIIGTVNHRVGQQTWPTENTTPDPVTLQKRLRDFVDHQAVAVAMEVTSHALEQKRVASVHFNTVIFTNLTLDHLDYHKTMQNYFESKQKLFTDMMIGSVKSPQFAVVNIDDAYGKKLKIASDVLCWTYGKNESDFQFKIIKKDYSFTEFELKTPVYNLNVKLPLCGEHMIYNVVASAVAALSFGIPLEKSFSSLQNFYGVPGRLQSVFPDNQLNEVLYPVSGLEMLVLQKRLFIDYAHTPDALENTLKTLNDIRTSNSLNTKIICVFGCGGDRDKSKRPLMGKIATELSDYTFVTSDNPRTESPMDIINDIVYGILPEWHQYSEDLKKSEELNADTRFHIEVDRELAIKKAILKAHPGDVVLIAGKGHEDYQIIGTEKKYFSDLEVARKYLNDKSI